MVKVICLLSRVGTGFSHVPGDVIEVDPGEVSALIEAGHVQMVEPVEASAADPVEPVEPVPPPKRKRGK